MFEKKVLIQERDLAVQSAGGAQKCFKVRLRVAPKNSYRKDRMPEALIQPSTITRTNTKSAFSQKLAFQLHSTLYTDIS